MFTINLSYFVSFLMLKFKLKFLINSSVVITLKFKNFFEIFQPFPEAVTRGIPY